MNLGHWHLALASAVEAHSDVSWPDGDVVD